MENELIEPPSHRWRKQFGTVIGESTQKLGLYVVQAAGLLFKFFQSDRKLGYKLGFLMIMAMMPMVSQAAMDAQVSSEIKLFSQPIDPINAGEFAQNVSRYTPGISADKDDVALSLMAKNDSYTLAQQLSVNSNRQIEEPVRQQATYTVQKGETITQIAAKFNLHVASILDANSMKATELKNVQPGTVLNIPSSDTSTSDDWIVAINKAAEEEKKKQQAAQQAAAAAAAKKKKKQVASTRVASYSGGGSVNGVRYIRAANANEMQCYTYVVSQGYPVGGHMLARWIPTNSSTPRAGGLVVTNESWAGHVAIVTSVNDDGTFNIRESNYVHGLITERTLSANSGKIIGFVN